MLEEEESVNAIRQLTEQFDEVSCHTRNKKINIPHLIKLHDLYNKDRVYKIHFFSFPPQDSHEYPLIMTGQPYKKFRVSIFGFCC